MKLSGYEESILSKLYEARAFAEENHTTIASAAAILFAGDSSLKKAFSNITAEMAKTDEDPRARKAFERLALMQDLDGRSDAAVQTFPEDPINANESAG